MTNIDARSTADDVFAEMAAAVSLTYTQAVKVFCAARGGKDQLERLLRTEISTLFRDGLPSVEALLVHSVSWHGKNNIILSGTDRGMKVNLCTHEKVASLSCGDEPDLPLFVPVPYRT